MPGASPCEATVTVTGPGITPAVYVPEAGETLSQLPPLSVWGVATQLTVLTPVFRIPNVRVPGVAPTLVWKLIPTSVSSSAWF